MRLRAALPRPLAAWALGGLVIASLAACGGGSDAPGGASPSGPVARDSGPVRDVILISVDTLRWDALGFAGNPRSKTPFLDRLAAEGRFFPNAHAHAVMTLPSHASMLTGLYPYEHGVRHNGGFVLGDSEVTLAESLAGAGFMTGAVIGAFPLDARFGLDRGFASYDDEIDVESGDQLFRFSERSGAEVVARAREWWQRHEGEKRFLFLHLFDPHAPYAPPEPYATEFADAPYLGEVAAVDGHLAAFLAPIVDARDSTLVAFTSDHGESLGEHGEMTHGLFAYESTLRVPLLLWGGPIAPGRDERPARHVDLLPTLLDAADVRVPEGLSGISLLAEGEHPDHSYFEALSANLDFGWAPLRGVLAGGEKFIDLPLAELYDLADDPAESTNLFADERRRAATLASRLPEESVWPPEAAAIGEEEAARLRSLGYLAGQAPAKASYGPADDPKNLVELDRKVQRLPQLALAGRVAEAEALGREILAERPDLGLAYVYLSRVQLESGDPVAAVTTMREAVRRGVASAELERQLGLTLVSIGQPAEALEVLARVPGDEDAETLNVVGLAQAQLGRFEDATRALARSLELDPDNARGHENLSFVFLQMERFGDAEGAALAALDLDSERPSSWNNLGLARYNLGRVQEALEAWSSALRLAPNDVDTLLNFGVVAAESGAVEPARRALSRFIQIAPSPSHDAARAEARDLLARLGS